MLCLTTQERKIIEVTQSGLPVTARPFADVAQRVGLTEQEVIEIFRHWQATGLLRRIALVPNHYRAGYRYNLMTVWDIEDRHVDTVGEHFAALHWVSHCYRRPRKMPNWPYNLFAMIHATSEEALNEQHRQLITLSAPYCRGHDALISRRILKKTGFRLDTGGH